MEIEMEVVCYEEAVEYCESNNLILVDCTYDKDSNRIILTAIDNSKRGELEDSEVKAQLDITDKEYERLIEPVNTCIYTNVNNGRMYIAKKKGVTFSINEAKRFRWSDAIVKVKYMNENGKHRWNVYKTKA